MEHWVDAEYGASWRAPCGADDRDDDEGAKTYSEEVDRADYAYLRPQLEALLSAVNSLPCAPEARADYRDRGVAAVSRQWGQDLFVWAEPGGHVDLDWAAFGPMTPRQRARACFLVYLALTNIPLPASCPTIRYSA